MGQVGDKVVFRGEVVLVAPSVEVVWAPSRGVKGSIGSYGLKVVGCMRRGGRVVEKVVMKKFERRGALGVVWGISVRVSFEGGGIERQVVVMVVLSLL